MTITVDGNPPDLHGIAPMQGTINLQQHHKPLCSRKSFGGTQLLRSSAISPQVCSFLNIVGDHTFTTPLVRKGTYLPQLLAQFPISPEGYWIRLLVRFPAVHNRPWTEGSTKAGLRPILACWKS
ncbi:uncharacterized protein LOC143839836 [Paroedura picta]|uniref:uncharacterized protein LOC143839836 n=1 Tax=Paroedura picta TaxID=143630 RepID=UPI0040577C1F